jgi:hypothetical protein
MYYRYIKKMGNYKKYIKTLLENSFALVVLVSIILISIFGVISLNPIAKSEESTEQDDLSVSNNQDTGQIIVDTKYQQFRHEMNYYSQGNSIFYSIIPKSLEQGDLEVEWVRINNLFNSNKSVKIIPSIQGEDWNILELNIIHNEVAYPLIENAETKSLEINIPADNIASLYLQYKLTESINYPIQINLELQY